MTTAFILVINLLVAGAFALAFAFLATNDRRAIGPRWLAASCAMGVIDISFEFALYLGGHPTAFAVGIFIVFLAASRSVWWAWRIITACRRRAGR